jgi:sensor domain CHASE-containing protein
MLMSVQLNGDIVTKVALVALALAVTSGWTFLASRASDEDVKENTKKVEQVKEDVDRRIRATETNVVKMCQFLDRQDKNAGGPGLGCKDPE